MELVQCRAGEKAYNSDSIEMLWLQGMASNRLLCWKWKVKKACMPGSPIQTWAQLSNVQFLLTLTTDMRLTHVGFKLTIFDFWVCKIHNESYWYLWPGLLHFACLESPPWEDERKNATHTKASLLLVLQHTKDLQSNGSSWQCQRGGGLWNHHQVWAWKASKAHPTLVHNSGQDLEKNERLTWHVNGLFICIFCHPTPPALHHQLILKEILLAVKYHHFLTLFKPAERQKEAKIYVCQAQKCILLQP